MADTKISAAGDAGVLISTDMVPLARSGNVNAFRATMAEVATYTSAAAPVQSVATRTGAVTLTHTDITDWVATLSPYALLASPTFTGTPSLPTGATGVTQTAGTSNTSLATTAFVGTALGNYAPLASPVFTGDARAVTPAYGDNDTSVATSAFVQSAVAPAMNGVGRNLVTNGTFVVAQRGAGPWTANGYTMDRWWMHATSDTFSIQQLVLVDSDRTQIGDDAATNCLRNIFTGNAAAAANSAVTQPIENARRLSNKTVTVSFWATAAAAGLKIGVSIDQNFGTGGSPSAQVNGNGQAVALGTAWARYSLTFAVPSVAGLTLGTNGDHATYLNFWFSSGTTNAARAGSVGVQSGTAFLYGIQLEIGSVATPLDAGGTPAAILAECQRFYALGALYYQTNTTTTSNVSSTAYLPVSMRANPTITPTWSNTNITSPAVSVLNPASFAYWGTPSAAGNCLLNATFTASADL